MFRWFGCMALLVASLPLLADEADDAQRAKDERIVQTVLRLPGFDLNSKPEAKAAVLRHLGRIEGQDKYFEIVDKLNLAADVAADLLKQALANPESNASVNCASLLLKVDQTTGLKEAIEGKEESAVAAITALGLTGQVKALPLIEPLLGDDQRSAAVRSAAVRALGK